MEEAIRPFTHDKLAPDRRGSLDSGKEFTATDKRVCIIWFQTEQ